MLRLSFDISVATSKKSGRVLDSHMCAHDQLVGNIMENFDSNHGLFQ